MQKSFYEIKQAYQSIGFGEIQSRIYNMRYIYICIALVGAILSSLCMRISIGFSFFFIFFYFGITLYLLRQKENKFFYSQFNVEESFLKDNQNYRTGQRSLLFFEKINFLDFDYEKIQERLNIEIECKIFNIWNIPYVIAAFAILGMILKQFISLKEIQPFVVLITLGAFMLAYSVYLYFEIFRTEEAKMKELKLFLYWYNSFGKAMVKNEKDIVDYLSNEENFKDIPNKLLEEGKSIIDSHPQVANGQLFIIEPNGKAFLIRLEGKENVKERELTPDEYNIRES